MKKLLVAAALVGLVAVIAGPAIAGGKGSRTVATISLASSDTARIGAPSYGDEVWFSVDPVLVKDRDLGHLWVTNVCRVDGVAVLLQHRGVEYETYRVGLSGGFPLTSASWSGGPATCSASVWMWPDAGKILPGATTTYSVGG